MPIIKYSSLIGSFIEIYTYNDPEVTEIFTKFRDKFRLCSKPIMEWRCAYSNRQCGNRAGIAEDIGDSTIYNISYGCSKNIDHGHYGSLFSVKDLGRSLYNVAIIKRRFRNPETLKGD